MSSTTATLVIAALLAALLIAYVFAGGGRRSTGPETHCSSRQAFDQIKRELFRRAAAVRRTDERTFAQVADYSVVRMNPRVFRRVDASGMAHCSGPIALDLPPGVQAIGGRRTLAASVSYSVAGGTSGEPEVRSLSPAETIVQPLATLMQSGTQPQPAVLPAEQLQPSAPQQQASDALTEASPSPAATQPAPTARSRAARSPEAPVRGAQQSIPPVPPARPKDATAANPPKATSPPILRPATPSRPVQSASAAPSFNCRYARTRGEIAVCKDSRLASLDRQMASQFNSAMSVASPGARVMLRRTRDRFLRYRDSCASNACMAESYQGRMREISEIMSRF